MSFTILNKQILSKGFKRLDILAPKIANKIKPGQFVRLAPDSFSSGLTVPVIDWDPKRGTIAVILKEEAGVAEKLDEPSIGDNIFSILGPLGQPASVEKKGKVVIIANGLGTARILSIARAYKELGSKVFGVFGAKSKKDLILEAQLRLVCDRIYLTTEDGSLEHKGKATDLLTQIIRKQKIHVVYAAGSPELLQSVCSMTAKKKIKTFVQLFPVMVDCAGLCGSCRVRVNERSLLACIEGPEFDGHSVDFEDYTVRLNAFKENHVWDSHPSTYKQSPGESRIFKRFLSGILKE